MYGSIYVKCLEEANLETRKIHQWLPRGGRIGGKGDCLVIGIAFFGGGDEYVLKLIVVMVTQSCEYSRNTLKTFIFYLLNF